MTPPEILRITTLDLKVKPFAWPFADERRDEIDAHFAERRREKPAIWNGRVLLGRNAVRDGEHLAADYFETDFASFLAWRDWGFPGGSVFNGFGMGALRASDGAFLLGEMAAHTANAGRIYFPAGTPDLDDVVDGAVDLAGNVTRELRARILAHLPHDPHQELADIHIVRGPADVDPQRMPPWITEYFRHVWS